VAVTFLTDNTPEITVCCLLHFMEEEINVSLQGPKPLLDRWIWFLCPVTLYQNSRRMQLVKEAAQIGTVCCV